MAEQPVVLVTPILPMETGLATYAMRVLSGTAGTVPWIVAYPEGGDPDTLPDGVDSIPLSELDEVDPDHARIYQLGNSPHCFDVARSLYRHGGTAVFHETVLHHMLRHGYHSRNMLDEYKRELVFCFGPAADAVWNELNAAGRDEGEFDAAMKRYPLTGRAVHASHSAVCLNPYAFSVLRDCYPPERLLTVGHPLTQSPPVKEMKRMFSRVVGMVGTCYRGRNLKTALESVKILRRSMPEAGLLLIGAGYPDDLPEWAVSTGRLPEDEYQGYIRTLDCLLDLRNPSCGETSGSLLEAMRAGVPPVLSAQGSFLNIPSNGVIRVPLDNLLQGSAAALEMILNDDELRRDMSAAARGYAEDTGSRPRMLADWRRVLEMAEEAGSSFGLKRKTEAASPAWMDPPEGFTQDLSTPAVTWTFSGEARLCCSRGTGAWVTACGRGTVGERQLTEHYAVHRIDSGEIIFSGEGRVSSVLWS